MQCAPRGLGTGGRRPERCSSGRPCCGKSLCQEVAELITLVAGLQQALASTAR